MEDLLTENSPGNSCKRSISEIRRPNVRKDAKEIQDLLSPESETPGVNVPSSVFITMRD